MRLGPWKSREEERMMTRSAEITHALIVGKEPTFLYLQTTPQNRGLVVLVEENLGPVQRWCKCHDDFEGRLQDRGTYLNEKNSFFFETIEWDVFAGVTWTEWIRI